MNQKTSYQQFRNNIKQLPLCEQLRLHNKYKEAEKMMKRSELNNKIIKWISFGALALVIGVVLFGLLKCLILTILKW